MRASELDEALATFSDIVARKPAFAEGWNKRATIYFLIGENEKSLRDCDEVLRRNPNHFGALSGAGQIHLSLGNPERALEFFNPFDIHVGHPEGECKPCRADIVV